MGRAAIGQGEEEGEASGEIRLYLRPGREKALRDGNPWLFSGAIAREEGPRDAPLAQVFAADGRSLGVGFHSPRSQIRARLLGGAIRGRRVDREFWSERIERALALRAAVLPAETTGYRVLNAEGDGLPGWTVDRFGPVLVSQITVAGLEALRGEAYAALERCLPGLSILQSNGVPARRAEGLDDEGDEVIAGEPPAEAEFLECGLRFAADLSSGQKTGFYCDQRDNRALARRIGGGKDVLDLFAHSGGFGLSALAGGARRAVHVESSAKLIERGRRTYERNGIDPDRGEWVQANVFADLRERGERYGLVVCDPPPLVRKRPDLDAAARAYKDLNRLAFGRVEPGGFLLTFSCSGAVDARLFRQILFAAATEAGVQANLLAPLAAAPDHPVSIAHLQGEYLKGWWIEVRAGR